MNQNPRRLLIAIAIALIVVFVLGGFAYRAQWLRAGEDLSKLLPGSTWAYVASEAPTTPVTKAMALPVWTDPGELQRDSIQQGYLAAHLAGDIVGLPSVFARRLFESMNSLGIALVPSGDGATLLAFVRLDDPVARKQATARLREWAVPADRQVGFRIDRVARPLHSGGASPSQDGPFAVEMAPYLVIGWGSREGLADVLDARVAGLSGALRDRRSGPRFTPQATTRGLRGVLTPPAITTLVGAEALAGVDMLRLESQVDPDGETLSIVLVHDEGAARALKKQPLFGDGEPGSDFTRLLAAAPASAIVTASTNNADPTRLVSTLKELVARAAPLAEHLPGYATLKARTEAAEVEVLSRVAGQGAAAFTGEAVFSLFHLPAAPEQRRLVWHLTLEVRDPEAASLVVARVLPGVFGRDYAFGEVLADEGPIWFVRQTAPDGLGGPTLAWRTVGNMLHMAPTVADLDRAAGLAATNPLEASTAWQRIKRFTGDHADAVLVAKPAALAISNSPLAAALRQRLAPDYRFVLTVDAAPSQTRLRANLGPWALAAVLATSDRAGFDLITLTHVSPACRRALELMCQRYPDAWSCHPFHLGREAIVKAACQAAGVPSR